MNLRYSLVPRYKFNIVKEYLNTTSPQLVIKFSINKFLRIHNLQNMLWLIHNSEFLQIRLY